MLSLKNTETNLLFRGKNGGGALNPLPILHHLCHEKILIGSLLIFLIIVTRNKILIHLVALLHLLPRDYRPPNTLKNSKYIFKK